MLKGAIWDLDGTLLDSMSAWDHVGENYLRSQGIEPEPDLDEAIATMSLHQAADYFIEHYGVKQTRDELIKSAVAIVDDFYRYEAQLKPHLKEFLAQLHEIIATMSLQQAADYFIDYYGVKQTPDDLIKGAVAIVDDFYRYEAQLKPHAAKFLTQLHQAGVKMCIATAAERSLVETVLTRCGVLHCFSEIFTCTSVGAGKDEPAIYREAMKFLGTDRSNTIVFEDSLHALTTAKNDGFYVAAVYDEHEEHQDEIRRIVDCIITDYDNPEEFNKFIQGI